MFSIRWKDGVKCVVGNKESILALANLFESIRVKFKVADVAGFVCKPEHFAAGGFEYWMRAGDTFGDYTFGDYGD
jgi:hypothetical protein